MSRYRFCCGASSEDLLQSFRVPSNQIPRANGLSNKRLANMGRMKLLTDEQIRRVMRNHKRTTDPWDRLEFFKRKDFEAEIMERERMETAKPIDRPDVVKATVAHEYYLEKLDSMRKKRLQEMILNGEATEEEIKAYEQECWDALEDPAEIAEAEAWLSPEDDVPYTKFPEEDDADRIDRSTMTYIEQLYFDYNVPGYIRFEEMTLQEGYKTPIACLSHRNGEQAVVTLHGGCVLAWMGPSGKNRFFIHPQEQFDNQTSIMDSGISLAFPFYNAGLFPNEGFLNKMRWDVVRTEVGVDWLPDPAPSLTLRCQDTPETRKIWPHRFEIFYKITLGESDEPPPAKPSSKERHVFEKLLKKYKTTKAANEHFEEAMAAENHPPELKSRWGPEQDTSFASTEEPPEKTATQLRLQFTVCNRDNKPMEFMFACKNHFRLRPVNQYGDFIRVLGLGARLHLDYTIVPGKPLLRQWIDDYLILKDRPEGWNSIFTQNLVNDVFFSPGYPEYFESVYRKGFPDVLLRHQGIKDERYFEVGNEMLMLGRGRVTVPAKLEPGEEWEGEFVLRHHDEYWREPVFGYQGGLPPPDESEMQVIAELDEGEEIETTT